MSLQHVQMESVITLARFSIRREVLGDGSLKVPSPLVTSLFLTSLYVSGGQQSQQRFVELFPRGDHVSSMYRSSPFRSISHVCKYKERYHTQAHHTPKEKTVYFSTSLTATVA